MTPRFRTSLAAAGFALALPTVANAQVGVWDLDAANAGMFPSIPVQSNDPDVSVSEILPSAGLSTPWFSDNSFCWLSWPATGALDPLQYFEWTVTPSGGFEVDYASMSLSVASGGTGTGTIEVRASTDGFSSSDIPCFVQSFPITATWQVYTGLDLTALGTQPGTVTFRFYLYDKPSSGFAGLGNNPGFGTGIDLSIDGAVNQSGGFPLACSPAASHSGGGAATLAGSSFSGPGAVHLEATGGPANQFGYFLISANVNEPGVALSNGFLCLGPPVGRYNPSSAQANGNPALNGIGQFNGAGVLQSLAGNSTVGSGFDVPSALPNPPGPGSITSGSTWSFQLWYRDGTRSNFSDVVIVSF